MPERSDLRIEDNVGFPDVELQDQDGHIFDGRTYLMGRPSILAFFYIRCMNANKCSLTITKMAEVSALLRSEGIADRVNVAAISYDPAFDTPDRLRSYGTDRGYVFDDRVRLLRTTGTSEMLQRTLGLSVGYGGATVNQHGRDMILLDDAMNLRSNYARLDWQPRGIVGELKAMIRC